MGYIDYSKEPQSDIAFVDMKSFYASVECVDRGLNPLHTSLCVMSRADNAGGLILASSPMFNLEKIMLDVPTICLLTSAQENLTTIMLNVKA